jgi:hypothetical protein
MSDEGFKEVMEEILFGDNPTEAFDMFRDLSPEEEQEFRQWARENDPPNLQSWEIYHPVCRDEWMKRGIKPPFDGAGI